MPDSANGYFEDSDVDDTDEDLKFLMYVDASYRPALHRALRKKRYEPNDRAREPHRFTVFRYYDEKVTYDTTVDCRWSDLRHHGCEECRRQ